MTRRCHRPGPSPLAARVRGAVLVVGLIFLVLLMLIGMTAYNVATMEERQAGNMRDRVRALEGAEYALRVCEADLAGAVVPAFSSGGDGGYYQTAAADAELYQKPGFDWKSSPTRAVADPQFGRDLRCVLERMDGAPIAPSGTSVRAELAQAVGTVYRITARGEGLSPGTVSIVQSYYHRD